jgi:hypothetical protein
LILFRQWFCAADFVFVARTNDASKAGRVCVKDGTTSSTEGTSRSTCLFKFAYVEENYVNENFDGKSDQRERKLSVITAGKIRYTQIDRDYNFLFDFSRTEI